MRTKILAAVMVVMLAALGALMFYAYQVPETAERQAQAVDAVRTRLVAYIRLNRQWPTSWEELQTTPTPVKEELMGGFGVLPTHVSIDFKTNLTEVARNGTSNFSAVRTVDRPYFDYRSLAETVVEAAREVGGTQR